MKLEFICQNDNIRLSEELKNHVSKKLYKNIKSSNSKIMVNNLPLETYKIINKGDIITVLYHKEKEIEWPLYESKLDILYEDDNYLVVNKPQGLLSIPIKSEPKSLYQEILYYLSIKNLELTASILNRLDKETKGLVVVAKNRMAAYYLQPTHEKMERRYKCLCHGIFNNVNGVIDNYIEKSIDSNKRFVSDKGKRAISHYKVLRQDNDKALVQFILDTGRTHQIRIHSSYIGHPILGDNMYGIPDEHNLCLCSYYVKFYNRYIDKYIEISIKSGWE